MVDFTGMTRHVGMLNNTGIKVVIAYMTLPGDDNNSLVIDVDALPDGFNDSLRRIVESVEGQQSYNLGDVLGRRMSPDGSQLTILQKLHASGRLQKVPVELVSMTPRPGIKWPLREVLKAIKQQDSEEPDGFDDLDPETKAQVAASIKKFNVHASNIDGEASSNTKDQAIGLIKQAELMESEAQRIRLRAYSIDPSLAKPNPSKQKKVKTKDTPETATE